MFLHTIPHLWGIMFVKPSPSRIIAVPKTVAIFRGFQRPDHHPQ